MYNLNNVVIEGRLTEKPKARSTGSKTVCTLTVAVNFHRGGDKEPGVDFIPVVVFGKLADNCVQYLDKGQSVYVTARVKQGTTKAFNKAGEPIDISVPELWAENVQFGVKAKSKAKEDAVAV